MTILRRPSNHPVSSIRPSRLCAVAFPSAVAVFITLAVALPACAQPQGGAKVGEKVPDFTLRDIEDKEHALSAYLAQGKTVVLEWFNPDCPFVKKHHQAHRTMTELEQKYRSKDVVWLALNSGGPGKQGHGLERNRAARKDYAMDYPILLDESGKVGLAYGAKTTPHMYVVTPDGKLAYQGAIDDNASPAKLGGTNYVKKALEAVLAGRAVETAQTKPYGCSVKYAGN